MNNDHYIESLIAKVLSGEATATEVAEATAWKNHSEENREYFESLEKLFHLSIETGEQHEFDTDVAWNNLKSQLKNPITIQSKATPFSWSSPEMLLRIAAVLVIVAGMSYALFKIVFPEKVIPVTLASNETIQEHVLPDSSKVVLNRNSQLIYTYSGNKRKVALKGEAFFELASDNHRPFELMAGSLQIIDIGTSFNVNAPENGDSVVVIVSDGEVLLTSKGNKSISLIKGEQVTYYEKRDEFIKAAISDTNAIAYKTKIFVFENASLEIIVKKLGEVYNTNIQLSGPVATCHLTATFQDETLENILQIISETLKLELIKNGEEFILKGAYCDQ